MRLLVKKALVRVEEYIDAKITYIDAKIMIKIIARQRSKKENQVKKVTWKVFGGIGIYSGVIYSQKEADR